MRTTIVQFFEELEFGRHLDARLPPCHVHQDGDLVYDCSSATIATDMKYAWHKKQPYLVLILIEMGVYVKNATMQIRTKFHNVQMRQAEGCLHKKKWL